MQATGQSRWVIVESVVDRGGSCWIKVDRGEPWWDVVDRGDRGDRGGEHHMLWRSVVGRGGSRWNTVDHGGSRWLIAHPLVECRE